MRNAKRNAEDNLMNMGQFVARLDEDLADAIDALVADCVFESRSDAVRHGLEAVIDAHRSIKVGEAINDGYRRLPETEAELTLAAAIANLIIAAEPREEWDSGHTSG